MVTKETILSEIRRLAQKRNGRVGLRTFLSSTGIPQSQILGKYWATWNEAVADAGIEAASFGTNRIPEQHVLESLAGLIARLKKWPSDHDLSLARRRDRSFPSLYVFKRLRAAGDLPAKLRVHCGSRPELVGVGEIAAAQPSVALEKSVPIRAGADPRLRLYDAIWQALQDWPHHFPDPPPP